jgi:Putative zinc-binding metallo-peptidase
VFNRLLASLLSIIFLIGSCAQEVDAVSIRATNTNLDTRARTSTIRQILTSTALGWNYGGLTIMIDGFQREPRGRMQDRQISLSPYVERDTEFIQLFTHELAHYIDIYILSSRSGVDISDDFYHISWQSSNTKKSGQGVTDFVSGYASTNQYEDFAESAVLYIFHNAVFADRALRSDSLRQKYLFFASTVFPN